ncbi:MAG: hypothetical protein G01um101433_671 [Parcubacteria group bacterium Gr01-1014_33]|nr:MAG: hypothetical protein G01um101433_671 [Parcubacteria group bacterium Gr01-1014_33]
MNTAKERVFAIIDGSNFYHRLKELQGLEGNLLDFRYTNFVQWLTGERSIVQKTYYIGVVRAKPDDKKAQTLRRNQQRLFAELRKDGWSIARGYLLESGGTHHEKGVDVQIAVDLLVGAYENLYDTAILLSSDTDLIPALAKIRSMGKKVEYVGFSQKPSYGLITHSDVRRLLLKEDVQQFLPRVRHE